MSHGDNINLQKGRCSIVIIIIQLSFIQIRYFSKQQRLISLPFNPHLVTRMRTSVVERQKNVICDASCLVKSGTARPGRKSSANLINSNTGLCGGQIIETTFERRCILTLLDISILVPYVVILNESDSYLNTYSTEDKNSYN